MKTVTKINFICVALIFGLLLAACSSLPNNVIISTKVFIGEFSENETNAFEKYSGKRITITGIIFEKATPKDNIPEKDFNYLVFGEYSKNGIGIQCYFNEFVYSTVETGETVTVEGNFREITYAGDLFKMIVLGECKIIK
jgi:hypothetical protein